MKGFIELTHLWDNGERVRTVVAVSQIVAIAEYNGQVYVFMGRDKRGRLTLDYRIEESYEKVLCLLAAA